MQDAILLVEPLLVEPLCSRLVRASYMCPPGVVVAREVPNYSVDSMCERRPDALRSLGSQPTWIIGYVCRYVG